MKKIDLNQFLIANPKAVEGIFTRLFGRYFMRYYKKAKGYSVDYSSYESSSYNDARSKQIVIAAKNVNSLLKLNIPILAVAYHELAHTLYTSQTTKHRILEQVRMDTSYRYTQHLVHTLWNVLEDERIERKMMKQYKFLKPIIENLTDFIKDDFLVMSWRKGNHHLAPQQLVALCEEFANKTTIDRSAKIIIEILETFVKVEQLKTYEEQVDDAVEEYEDQKELDAENDDTIEDDASDDDTYEDDVDEGEDEIDAENDDDEEDYERQSNNEDDVVPDYSNEDEVIYEEAHQQENNDNADDNVDEDVDDVDDDKKIEEFDDEEKPEEDEENFKELTELEKMFKDLERVDAGEQEVVLDILKGYQNDVIEQIEIAKFNRSVKPTTRSLQDHKKGYRLRWYPIKNVYNAKHKLRQGMSQAQTKAFSLNISNRVSVQRLIEAKSSRKEPKVFYGKGKDVEFMRKVVIFEDVSASTHSVSPLFSSIGLALANSFEMVEWWAYGNYLYQKHQKDFKYSTYACGGFKGLNGGTNSQYLLNVMRKYRSQDCLYVIITDGDMGSFFRDDETYKIFKDKTCVVGLLDDDIKAKMPHHYDISAQAYDRWSFDVNSKAYAKLVVDAVTNSIEILQKRIG